MTPQSPTAPPESAPSPSSAPEPGPPAYVPAVRLFAPGEAPRWNEIFRHTAVALAVSDAAAGRLLFATPAFERMHGYGAGEMEGLPVEALFAPRGMAGLAELVRRVERERVVAMEALHRRRDGGELPVWMDARVVLDDTGRAVYRLVTCDDLTARKEAERALRESEARLRVTFDEAPMGIAEVALDGRTLGVNRALAQMLGYEQDELAALSFQAITHPDDVQADQDAAAELVRTGRPFSLEKRYLRRGGGIVWGRLTASLVRDADGAALYAIGVVEDVTPQRQAAERLRLLARAGDALAATLDVRATLEALARLPLPEFADYCAVDLLRPDGTFERAAAAHVAPEKEALLMESARRFPHVGPRVTDPGLAAVLAGGPGLLVPELTPEVLARLVPHDGQREIVARWGPRSHAVVPLRVGEQVMGVLSLGISEGDRRYGPDDLAVAAELAHRGAMALENARLFEAAGAARREADALQAATAALSRAATVEEVARAVVGKGLALLDAAAGSVVLVSDDGSELLTVAVTGYDAERVRPFARFSPDRRLPTRDVVRTGQAVFVRSLAEWRARYDPPVAGLPFEAAAVLPLHGGDRLLGMLTLRFATAREFDDAERARMETLATQCAQALDRARLFEAEARARRRAEDEAARVRHLQALTTRLARAATPGEVAEVALERARVAFAAAGGIVTVVTEDGREFVNLGAAGFGPDDVDRWRRYPVDAGTPGGEVLRTGEPVIVTSLAEAELRFPVLAPVLRARGYPSFVSLPLTVDGRITGLVAFLFAAERGFPPDDLAQMTAFAGQCAQAMARARAYQAEREARAQAEEARLRAEEANAAKMQFLATMSHELRTPLNAIAGYAELLEMEVHGPLLPAQREALQRIQRSERHLLSLINDVLNFARLDAGHVELQPRPVTAAELLAGLEALVEPQLRARGQRFHCAEVPAETRMMADVEKVRQVLLNLLSNAIKFTPEGGEIAIDAEAVEGAVRIHVRDTGVGIAPDKLERVFEPFVQLDRSLTSSHEGTGLGLSISRDLARAMGGDITATSRPGTGSVFTLILPAAP